MVQKHIFYFLSCFSKNIISLAQVNDGHIENLILGVILQNMSGSFYDCVSFVARYPWFNINSTLAKEKEICALIFM